jgi:hypothetical protein
MFLFHGVQLDKKITVPALILTLLFSALAGMLLIKLVSCSIPLPDKYIPTVDLQSPENKVYAENSVPLDFSVGFYVWADHTVQFFFQYSLDGSTWMLLTGVHQSVSDGVAVCGSSLNGLSEGLHSVRVQVEVTYRGTSGTSSKPSPGASGAVSFTVNAAVPRVTILSLKQLKTYNTTALPLEFAVSEPAASLSYSLDGGASVSIAGNTSLSGLSEGKHTIIVQAEDSAGSVGESSVTFTVETAGSEQPDGSQPAPFPTTLVAVALIVSVAAVSFGLVAYLLRRKKRRRAS